MLQPHEVRVIGEKDELDTKLKNLSNFIGSKPFLALDVAERCLLVKQEEAMSEYSAVLGKRIAIWENRK